MACESVSDNSDDSDSVGRPVTDQISGQPTPEVTMTLGKCLLLLVAFELLLAVAVFGMAAAAGLNVPLAMGAWAVCAVGTMGAHVFSWFPKGDEFLLARLAGGMIFRTAFPLGFAIWGLKFNEPRIEASIVLVLALVYMAGLIADSWVNLRRSKQV